MYKVKSQTLTEAGKSSLVPLSRWRFNLTNGNTGSMTVSDVLLDTEEAALERAKSELLKNGHRLKELEFATYRTDFKKNDILSIRGLNYLVKSTSVTVSSVSIVTKVKVVRYE